MTMFVQRMHVLHLRGTLEKRKGVYWPSCFQFAHCLTVSVPQAADTTLSLGQICLLAPVCLPDLAGTSLWVPPISGDDTSGILALLNF